MSNEQVRLDMAAAFLKRKQETEDAGFYDFTVRVELSITAENAQEAARFALDDLRDLSIGPWNFECQAGLSNPVITVSVGDPDEPDPLDADEDEDLPLPSLFWDESRQVLFGVVDRERLAICKDNAALKDVSEDEVAQNTYVTMCDQGTHPSDAELAHYFAPN